MNTQSIIDVLQNNNIKTKRITTTLNYQIVEVKLSSRVGFERVLEVIAASELNEVAEVKHFGKYAMVYIPGSKM